MKKNIWYKILPITFLSVTTITVALESSNIYQLKVDSQECNFNTFYFSNQSSTSSKPSYISLPKSINVSLYVFLEWAENWLKESTNILNWLQQLNFQINDSIKVINLKQKPKVNLLNQNQIKNVEVELIINNEYKNNVSLNLLDNFFQPIIVVPHAINLYKEDFLQQLQSISSSTGVNKFLENCGFQINPIITPNIYTNKNFKYNQETETITIEFLQYKDEKNPANYIYKPISFNIKNIYFQLPLNKNPSAIIGILLALVILALLFWYIAIKIKKNLDKKKNEPKVIPAWKLDKDKQKQPIKIIELNNDNKSINDTQHDLAVNTDVQLDYLNEHEDKKETRHNNEND